MDNSGIIFRFSALFVFQSPPLDPPMCLPLPLLLVVSSYAGLKFPSQTEMVSFWATRSVCAFWALLLFTVYLLCSWKPLISRVTICKGHFSYLISRQRLFYLLSPHGIRWCTKRRTLTVQSISGQWREMPLTVSSWLVWGNMCSMRSRFWLSHGLGMDVPVLQPSWRGLWMMVGTWD